MNILKSTLAIAGLTLASISQAFANPGTTKTVIKTDFSCQPETIYYLKVISKDGIEATNRGNFECEGEYSNYREVKFEQGDFKYENGDKVEIWAEDKPHKGNKPRKVLTCLTEITAKTPHLYLTSLMIDLDIRVNCTLYSIYKDKGRS